MYDLHQGFEWDEENTSHVARHGVTPQEAEEALTLDPLDFETQQVDHEERFSQIGITRQLRVLYVVATWRGEVIRVVTAFPAAPHLRELYASERKK